MKKIIYILSITTLIILVLFVLNKMQQQKKVFDDILSRNINEYKLLESYSSILKDRIVSSYKYGCNITYMTPDSLLDANDNRKVHLKDLSSNYKLVFYFSEMHCQTCVNEELKILKKSVSENNIIYLASYNSLRNLNAFKRINSLRAKVYNIQRPILNNVFEVNVPFFAVINKDGALLDVFIPSKHIPDLTKSYLDIINEKFKIQ